MNLSSASAERFMSPMINRVPSGLSAQKPLTSAIICFVATVCGLRFGTTARTAGTGTCMLTTTKALPPSTWMRAAERCALGGQHSTEVNLFATWSAPPRRPAVPPGCTGSHSVGHATNPGNLGDVSPSGPRPLS